MSKRCFIISPIGEPGSPIREHADDVLDFIIKPAMEELGIFAYRADHSQQVGRITDQMYSSILNEDVCIAILSYHNPNVFYELAIAQSAARPVIILIEKGQTIPFDLKDVRAIEYDLKPRPLRDKVYSNQIIEHVKSLETLNWTVDVPFGHGLAPLGAKMRHSQFKLHPKMEDFGTTDHWASLLRSTAHEFDLSGLTLAWWTKSSLPALLRQKAAEGCKIRILQMHPENPALGQYLNKSITLGHRDLANEINGAYSFFQTLSREQPNIETRQVLNGGLHQMVIRSDDVLLTALFLFGENTAQWPMLECSAQSSLYAIMRGEFEALWNGNALPDSKIGAPHFGFAKEQRGLAKEQKRSRTASAKEANGARGGRAKPRATAPGS